MNYLQTVANKIKSEVPVDVLPDAPNTNLLFNMYATLLLAKGSSVTLEDVHNAWVAWMSEENTSHASIKPFKDLDKETQLQDKPYLDAIIRAVSKL